MSFQIVGLKRCSTCVKAKKWLEAQGHEVLMIDVREQVPSAEQLTTWAVALGWDKLINKASQTWRQLDDSAKVLNSEADRIALIQAHPSVMKRPLLIYPGGFKLGFSEASYQEFVA
ncbi:Spx/MgsR family RNA polymerase-binding regulatory protein [Oligella urethralis]|uniref:arsenate reductase family protein n=1 Tax=Oligella urethralis TaxID=90245 RepID=UPI00254D3144|nr:Spx/MgsR family RNA polymerase-binding regulatory protein [Oligella urethralis]MDK6203022.1 Spx/MgsR family RNA polymerase-binding regulatory protein [Oligella urethralis]